MSFTEGLAEAVNTRGLDDKRSTHGWGSAVDMGEVVAVEVVHEPRGTELARVEEEPDFAFEAMGPQQKGVVMMRAIRDNRRTISSNQQVFNERHAPVLQILSNTIGAELSQEGLRNAFYYDDILAQLDELDERLRLSVEKVDRLLADRANKHNEIEAIEADIWHLEREKENLLAKRHEIGMQQATFAATESPRPGVPLNISRQRGEREAAVNRTNEIIDFEIPTSEVRIVAKKQDVARIDRDLEALSGVMDVYAVEFHGIVTRYNEFRGVVDVNLDSFYNEFRGSSADMVPLQLGGVAVQQKPNWFRRMLGGRKKSARSASPAVVMSSVSATSTHRPQIDQRATRRHTSGGFLPLAPRTEDSKNVIIEE